MQAHGPPASPLPEAREQPDHHDSPPEDSGPGVPSTAVPAPADPFADLRASGARTVALTVGALGAVLALASLAELAFVASHDVANKRALLGAALIAAAVVANRLRHRYASAALVGLFGAVVVGLAFTAWSTGLGVHMVTFGGVALVIATAGPALGPPGAYGLALLYLVGIGTLAWGEMAGLIPGREAAIQLPLASRLVGHGLVAVAGVLAAALLSHLVEAALARASRDRERLAELLDLGSDWTFELDARSQLTALSPSFEARTGFKRSDFARLGEPGQPYIVDDDNWRALQQALRERRPFRELLCTYVGPGGAPMHALFSGTPVFDGAGQHTGWRGVGRNVTAEREMLLAQRRTETLLNRLYEASPDAICVGRASDGRILLANAGFLKFTGLTQREVVGRTIGELHLWPDLEEPRRVLREIRAGEGSVRDLRSTVRLRDGSQREVLVTAAGFDSEGTTLAVVTLRDVTEIERARRESDAILDNAGVGIALVRLGRLERVNAALEAMFGWAPGTLAGERTSVLLPPVTARDDAARAPQEVLDDEREVTRRDGRRIRVHLHARPVDASQPLARGTIWVMEDVTERRADERALAEAKRDAEAANDAKSAFLATMSHEIRTPLNGVVGLARLLQDDKLDGSRRAEYLAHLADSAKLLSGIVSNVLDLSKIESGRLQIERIEFDLHELLHATFAAFAALGQERGLAMRCDLDPALPRLLRGDPVRLRQIVANYLSNALKFTERGGISLTAVPAGGERVRVAVRDSGPGVSAALQGRLFEPFLQADSSTTRRFGGTGLGLSICRQLARLMGGEVGVESSEAGEGSVFWAELPLPAVATAVPEAAASAAGAEAAAAAGAAGSSSRGSAGAAGHAPLAPEPLRGLTVLVAEDNAVNMLIVVAMLQRLGAEVVQAGDGEEALLAAKAHAAQLDAVLMDLHMPGRDGLAATRALRAEAPTASLPVYAFSAAVLEHERRAAQAAGMDGFIAKPVETAELLRLLGPLAAKRQAQLRAGLPLQLQLPLPLQAAASAAALP
ncbi:MAG: PAS domain S-box protein [Rubrivivax sp.]|nr:PAS domain S-box protein [Rubrivivax sp.]